MFFMLRIAVDGPPQLLGVAVHNLLSLLAEEVERRGGEAWVRSRLSSINRSARRPADLFGRALYVMTTDMSIAVFRSPQEYVKALRAAFREAEELGCRDYITGRVGSSPMPLRELVCGPFRGHKGGRIIRGGVVVEYVYRSSLSPDAVVHVPPDTLAVVELKTTVKRRKISASWLRQTYVYYAAVRAVLSTSAVPQLWYGKFRKNGHWYEEDPDAEREMREGVEEAFERLRRRAAKYGQTPFELQRFTRSLRIYSLGWAFKRFGLPLTYVCRKTACTPAE